MIMNQLYQGTSSGFNSHQSSSRTRKKSNAKQQLTLKQSHQQPVVIISQSGNNTQKGVKIKKEDLKLIQQYCEQNDLGVAENATAQLVKSLGGAYKPHKKTKSEGATPMSGNYLKNQFNVKQAQFPPQKDHKIHLGTPGIIDYQKYLDDERLYQQQPKSKSSLGYYSHVVQATPNNNTAKFAPHSKSPEPNYQSQAYKGNQMSLMPQSSLVGTSLSNYPMAQNALQVQSRGVLKSSQGTRSSSRKKSVPSGNQNNQQEFRKISSMNYNSNPNSVKNLFINKNPSAASYKLKSNSIQRPVHEQYSIDTGMVIPDQLNESSVYMYEDPLMKSNHYYGLEGSINDLKGKSQLSVIGKTTKNSQGHQISQHQNLPDESYMDASLYEQFIQGPHNLSHYSNPKEAEQSYIQYMTRSVSQNQHQPNYLTNPAHARSNSQYAYTHQQQQISKNTKKRAQAQTVQSSLNSSAQKQIERRMMMGRTPSPNFIKRIAGLMQVTPESLILQQHLYQSNASKNMAGNSSRRSTSKQQFSSNQAAQNTVQLIGNANHQMNRSLKSKLAKQYTTNHQVNRYKSGSITTSANTAQNSPTNNRGITPKRNNSSKQKTIQTIQQQQQQYNQKQLEFEQLAESYKRQVLQGQQQQINNQSKLKQINLQEEKKALAMLSGLDKHNISHQGSAIIQPHPFYQPAKIIGEIMEEDPQPLSSHEFIKFDEIKLAQQESTKGNKRSQQLQGQSTSKKSFTSPASQMGYYDGGTGSNKIGQIQNQLLMSKNSALSNETQTYSQHPSYIVPQTADYNQISLYLDQLQQKRTQIQKGMSIKSPDEQKSIQNFSSVPLNDFLIKKSPIAQEGSMNYHQNYQTNNMRTKTPSNLIKLIDESENSPADHQKKYNRKKTQSVEPPMIATPSVEMFKHTMNELEQRLKAHTNFQKKQQAIMFQQEKTPFEKELEQKAQEIKKKKSEPLSQIRKEVEQINQPAYIKDSISILKQLQESETIQEALMIGHFKRPTQQAKVYESNKAFGDSQKQKYPKQLQPQLLQQRGSDKQNEAEILTIDQKKQKGPHNKKYVEDDEEKEILVTQEEEKQIKDVISDLNEKAFYGKIMKKTKNLESSEFQNLSPRSREIATVMKFIKQSFEQNSEAPVTTTDFYRIGKMLGRGAFGKVNLAMHKLVRKLVAIKSLNKECLTDEAQTAKLMKEVSLLLKLRHNNVVKIYETMETEKHIIIVMELCAGGDLLNYVRKRRRLKEPYAKVIFKQIIDGLCYIHSKFIAHRDIKLDNILLDGQGTVKIADFGISKQATKGYKFTEQCGTPAYIAPEILKDKGYSFNVDIWSAGVVLFAMLYGTTPFKANNMDELHRLIVKGKYVLKDDISIEARNLLRGLLEVNPEKRLSIKQIYRHKWLADVDPNLQLFNEQEREMIKKEYTYNDPRRYNRNENEEPVDCFTEHHLESVYNSLKNASSKSIILAPFNSTQSHIDPIDQEQIQKLLCEKMMVLKFARRCREMDRQYEFNFNGEVDNGVYHNKEDEQNSDGDNDDENDSSDPQNDPEKHGINNDILSIPMLVSDRKVKKRGGRASVENSFEEGVSIQQMQDKQQLARKIKESSKISKEMMRNNKDKLVDEEMVQTYETFQSKYSSQLDNEKINSMVQYGYPYQYVVKTLEEGDPNYCTAGYYLLGMDQNYC